MKRIKITRRLLPLAATALLFTACDSFLTVDPDSYIKPEIFYSTKTEVEIGLAGIYGVLASEAIYGQGMIAFDTGTDEGYYNRRANENWTVSLYRHTTADNFIKNFWSSHYEAINLANLMIQNLSTTAFEQEEYDAYLAEAKFLRGLSYLNLTNYFDEVPLRDKPSTDQSSNHVAASTLAEVYDFIAADLSFAARHLPHASDSDYVPGRANKMAAHGLLARLYLKMAGNPMKDAKGYELAKMHCDTIINVDGWHKLRTAADNNGYRNHFLSYIQDSYDTSESLFEISFAYLRNMGLITDGRVGAVNGLRFWLNGGLDGPSSYSLVSASPVLLNSYDDEDARKAWNVPGMHYNNGNIVRQTVLQDYFCPGKYRRWEPMDYGDLDVTPPSGVIQTYVVLEKAPAFSPNFTSVNFPVIRYADVLLMYAEAENQINGPTSSAVAALNEVRNRAGLGNIEIEQPAAVSSKDNFFDELVEERMRELCFEGVRRNDLVRWGLLGERLEYLNRILKGTPNFSPTQDLHVSFLRATENFDATKHLSMPYPLQEVTINNKLEQKTAWAGTDN